jgi:hypothetical protein
MPKTTILKRIMIMKERKNQMKMTDNRTLPRWVFAILALGSFWASGVYLGIQSVAGVTLADLLRVIGFGIVGLLTAWGAIAKE